MEVRRDRRVRILTVFFVLALMGLFAVVFYGLPVISDASAAETQLALGVKTMLNMSVSPEDTLSIPILPSATGAYSTRKVTMGVTTNNVTGFTITMSGGESVEDPNSVDVPPGTIAGTNLVNSVNGTTSLLPTTAGTASSPTALGLNTWGYGVPKVQANSVGLLPGQTSGFDDSYSEQTSVSALTGGTKFAQIPDVSAPIRLKSTAGLTTGDQTEMYVGASVDLAKPSGSYRGTVVLSVVANYARPSPPFPTPTTLQDMTQEYCGWMGTNETVVLTDTRGTRQRYRVRKLADGKCWMVDNLKLGNTGEDLVLTPADSNLTENFALPPNAITETGSAAGRPNRLNNGQCDSGANSGTGDQLTCTGTSYGSEPVEVYNFRAYIDPSDQPQCLNNAPDNDDSFVYDPNSLTGCGYLYNWYTATAGGGVYETVPDDSQNTNAVSSSICPVGWRLPRGGHAGANAGNEFAVLNGKMYNGGYPNDNYDEGYENFRPTGPFSGSYAGLWTADFDGIGTDGSYFTSSASDYSVTRVAYLGYYGFDPGTGHLSMPFAGAMRCLLGE